MIERGTKVTLKRDGGITAIVLGEYMPGVYELRVFLGLGHVGDTVASVDEFDVLAA